MPQKTLFLIETFDRDNIEYVKQSYLDYKIDTKSEITPAEQVAIN